jgi:hypothetical protein
MLGLPTSPQGAGEGYRSTVPIDEPIASAWMTA